MFLISEGFLINPCRRLNRIGLALESLYEMRDFALVFVYVGLFGKNLGRINQFGLAPLRLVLNFQ